MVQICAVANSQNPWQHYISCLNPPWGTVVPKLRSWLSQIEVRKTISPEWKTCGHAAPVSIPDCEEMVYPLDRPKRDKLLSGSKFNVLVQAAEHRTVAPVGAKWFKLSNIMT